MTLNTASLIDHIAVSSLENIHESGVLGVALSDHYAVYCIRNAWVLSKDSAKPSPLGR